MHRPSAPAATKSLRAEVLDRLRDRSSDRPRFDPGLAGGLRAWLEDAAADLVAARGDGAASLYLGPRQLLGTENPGPSAPKVAFDETYSSQLITTVVVHALFRQLITTGHIADPLNDALAALSVQPRRAEMVAHIKAMDARSRAALSAEVRRQSRHLRNLTPAFSSGWLPRTDDRIAIPLAGGRVVLGGVFDLLVGEPVRGRASVCAVQITSGGPWAFARSALHYLALLETLRHGVPPFRLALLDATAGRYVVEDTTEEHLRAMVTHVVNRLGTVARTSECTDTQS